MSFNLSTKNCTRIANTSIMATAFEVSNMKNLSFVNVFLHRLQALYTGQKLPILTAPFFAHMKKGWGKQ